MLQPATHTNKPASRRRTYRLLGLVLLAVVLAMAFAGVAGAATKTAKAVSTVIPTITEVRDNFTTPAIVTSGPVGTVLNLVGTSFSDATSVKFNNVAAPTFSVISDTAIRVTVPAGTAVGAVNIVVTNIIGPSAANASFSVVALALTSFTPSSGPEGTVVTLTGTGFATNTGVISANTVVTFNGQEVDDDPVWLSATTISVIVPVDATSGLLAVTDPSGTKTATTGPTIFTVVPWPVIDSFTPSSGPIGTLVTIYGSGFTGATQVTFHDDKFQTTLTAVTDTQITAAVPLGTTTGPITVTTPAGTSDDSHDDFIVTANSVTVGATNAGYAFGANIIVNWATTTTMPAGTTFTISVVGAGVTYPLESFVTSSAGSSFTRTLPLGVVPVGSGYQLKVALSSSVYGLSPGSFAVTQPTPTITYPNAGSPSSYVQGDTLTVNWTCTGVYGGGEFGVWVRSSGGTWYSGRVARRYVAKTAGLTTTVTLNVPVGNGYQAIVAWRPAVGTGAWQTWSTQLGSFSVTGNGVTPSITSPNTTTASSYAQGATLTVNWTSSIATSAGEFGVWVRSSGGTWYSMGSQVAHNGTNTYTTPFPLAVPAGSGYQVIVAYRPVEGSGAWSTWSTQAGSFSVTGVTIAITPPTYGSTVTSAADIVVLWTATGNVASGQFGIWLRDHAGNWTGGNLVDGNILTSTLTAALVPHPISTDPYNIIVGYRPTQGFGAWVTFATSLDFIVSS